ncbi:MAG TPA: hypothetical protein PKA05_22270, partial [Roseiflexaceae bacterium]|nr:hypothetical protein [Roseiflexaceae bacterium]
MGQVEHRTARTAARITCEVLAGLIAMVLAHWMQVTVVRVVRWFVRRIGAALARGHGLVREIRELVRAIRAVPRRPPRSARP